MIYSIISFIRMILGIYGTILISKKNTNLRKANEFYLISDILAIILMGYYNDPWSIILFLLYSILAIIGIKNNKKKVKNINQIS